MAENAERPTVEGAEQSERRREILKIMRACGACPPEEFIEHYVKTGVLDGRLWPLRIPIIYP